MSQFLLWPILGLAAADVQFKTVVQVLWRGSLQHRTLLVSTPVSILASIICCASPGRDRWSMQALLPHDLEQHSYRSHGCQRYLGTRFLDFIQGLDLLR